MTFHVRASKAPRATRTSTTAGTPPSTCSSNTSPRSRLSDCPESCAVLMSTPSGMRKVPSAICGMLGACPRRSIAALSLLNLLQAHRHWTGTELSRRLGVTERTVRRDIDRLRELGYRIESTPGVAGGYRLEAGSAVPPLLLTDEEAVAMAIGLRVAATQRLVAGRRRRSPPWRSSSRCCPSRCAAASTPSPLSCSRSASHRRPAVSTEMLGELALACRDHERVRFAYTSASGEIDDAAGGAVCARPRRAALVPALLGHRARRLAHLPRRPGRRMRAHARALRAAGADPRADRGVHPVAPLWVRQPSRPMSSWTFRIDAMRECFGSGVRARRRRVRTRRGGRWAARTSARRCTACPGCLPGVSTRRISPSRRARNCAKRSSGCCAALDAPPPTAVVLRRAG